MTVMGDEGNIRENDNTLYHLDGAVNGRGPQETPNGTPSQTATSLAIPENRICTRGSQRDRTQAEDPLGKGTPIALCDW